MNAGTILALAGGLGLFLYGMEMMSEGIEKAAGAKLRSIVEMFTKNKFLGLIVGIIFTGIVQTPLYFETAYPDSSINEEIVV